MDLELPLKRRPKQTAETAESGSFPSDVTSAFADATFHPMPLNSPLDATAVLSTSTNGILAESWHFQKTRNMIDSYLLEKTNHREGW
ncbi:hypothetical protein COOONC_27543 [Cooperia oncophora]